MRAAWGFTTLTARTLFSGKRAWAALLLAALPCVVTALVVLARGERANGTVLFEGTVFRYTLWIMLYLQALIFGIALTSGEIEEGTAGYVYLGALPKWAITLIRIGVAGAALTALACASLILTALPCTATTRAPLESPARMIASATLLAGMSLVVALAFYSACGLTFRRPLVVSLAVTFIGEIVMPWLPVKFAAWTLSNTLRALMLPLLFGGEKGRWYHVDDSPLYILEDYGQAAVYLSTLAGVFLVAAMVASMNRSIAGRETRGT